MRRRRAASLAAGLAVLACGTPGERAPVPEERLAPLLARVEAARELRFRGPVDAESVTPAGVPVLLEAELDRSTPPEQLRREEALAKALGLLPPEADLRRLLRTWQSEAVAGFYSPADRRLFVVEETAGVHASGVLVHELAHALQDQHTRLLAARIGVAANDDLAFALGAFLEGDALWTELRDEAVTTGFPQPSAADFARRFAVDAPDNDGVPRLVRESFLGQYPLGYALATELVARGGVAALTAALADPPLSSEELLHRERYLTAPARRALPWFPEASESFAPEAGCETLASTSYGELGLRVWLRDGALGESEANAAADGWDGDRAWLLACPAGERLAWLVQLDSEADARELEVAALRRVRGAAPSPAVIERRGARLLVASGIAEPGRRFLLEELAAERYAGLATLLRERPEILERASAQRESR